MTGGTDRDEEHLPEHGVVEDFFARERARVEELPGHDLHWRSITRAAHRRPRRRTGRALAAVAALAVLAGGGAVAWQATGGGEDRVRPPAASATTTPPQVEVSGRQEALAFSAQGDDSRAVLTSAACGRARPCPVLWQTDDDGGSWHAQPLADLTAAPLGGTATGSDQVGLVRFGGDGRGWLAGSTVQRTEDGGRTWSDYPYPGGTVVAMEADRDRVRFVASDECGSTGCTGRLRVYEAASGATYAQDVELDVDLGSFSDVDLTTAREIAYLSVQTESGPRVWRLDGGRPEELKVCPDAETVDLAVPADGSETVTAVCETPVAGGTRVGVATTRDDGETWSEPRNARTVPGGRVVDATAPNGDALVVVTDARGPSGGSGIHRSTDDGESWSEVDGPSGPWHWIAAGGAGRVYAIARDGDLYESRDSGESWHEVSLG